MIGLLYGIILLITGLFSGIEIFGENTGFTEGVESFISGSMLTLTFCEPTLIMGLLMSTLTFGVLRDLWARDSKASVIL